MKTSRWIAALAVAGIAATALAVTRPDRALRVATGVAAHDLCSETFVGGLDPARTFAESLEPRPGFKQVGWAMRYEVDRQRQEVRATLGGLLGSRARYQPGWGCMLTADGLLPAFGAPARADGAKALLPDIAGPEVVAPTSPALRAAIDGAFAESPGEPIEATKAVVVVRDGHVIGERYASGVGVDTPLLGFSMSKSVVNALLGILVREGRLDVHAPAPIAAWQRADDPRRAITVEQLMRMTSGLDLDETGSGFDPSNQMFYVETRMADYAVHAKLKAPPGSRWYYSSAGVHLLARILRDRTGGTAQSLQRFATDELFAPLGMRHMTMEVDATGTPIGAHYMLGPARDWARLGSLFLDNGVVGGRRLLPEGWVRFSTTPTLETDYGAGWWPNRTSNPGGERRSKLDMPLMHRIPTDAFYALGNLGQYLVVVPSQRLVIVRMGHSQAKDFDVRHVEQLVASVVAAVSGAPAS